MTPERIFERPPAHLTRTGFLERYGPVYEHSPWIAERVWDAADLSACGTAEALSVAMIDVVARAGRAPQLALLRAHPDLAGKLAVAGELTDDSKSEQAGAQLDRCTPNEFREFQDLNGRYKAKFGFPFILAVKGKHRTEILEIFRRRILNDPDAEFGEALAQVHRIAYLRLCDID